MTLSLEFAYHSTGAEKQPLDITIGTRGSPCHGLHYLQTHGYLVQCSGGGEETTTCGGDAESLAESCFTLEIDNRPLTQEDEISSHNIPDEMSFHNIPDETIPSTIGRTTTIMTTLDQITHAQIPPLKKKSGENKILKKRSQNSQKRGVIVVNCDSETDETENAAIIEARR